MRLLVTADLHYNHGKSRVLAENLINQMNAAGGDILLVLGDTAAFDGPSLETCLNRFSFKGPKLFVAGNHEFWTHGDDSYANFRGELPKRVREIGWHWLQADPFVARDVAIVGNVGWYDYSFGSSSLKIPRRFYEAKISPGISEHDERYAHLLGEDVPAVARDVIARWNDGKFVKLHRSDDEFLTELLAELRQQLDAIAGQRRIVAAIHHLPFAELLPPARSIHWEFAKAYLGSVRIGELLLEYPKVSHVLCGHSHFAAEAQVGHIKAINIGSGYRAKRYMTLDINA